jgi:GNAT superfamily N-acetyltransferase
MYAQLRVLIERTLFLMLYALPEHFLQRPMTLDDIPALLELNHACDMSDFGRLRTSESDLRMAAEMPGSDLTKDSWVIVAPDGRLVGLGFCGHLPPISRLFTQMRVHPDYAGLGLYDYLYERILERAHDFIAEADEGVRVSTMVECPEKAVKLREALERAGLKHIRTSWIMRIDMDELPPEPVWPEGVELRPFTLDLARAVYEADDEAFHDHWGRTSFPFEAWELFTLKRDGFDPNLWFLAYEGDEIAGFSLNSIEQGEAWVGELGVRRPWRKKGLGLAFLRHSFRDFYQRGHRAVILNVDSENLTGATRLYTRAGMRPVEQTNTFEMELRPGVELSTETLEV